MKKRIAIIGPCYPYRGGNALFISHLYESLKEHFEVDMINYKLLYPSILFPGTTQLDKSGKHFSKIPSKRMVNSIGPLSWWKTAQYLIKTNPDLVVFDWWQPFFGPAHRAISSLIRKHFPNRILFLTENVISHEARWIDRFLTQLGLRHADKFLALSKIVEDDLEEFSSGQKIYRSELPVFNWFPVEDQSDKLALKVELGFEKSDRILLFFGYIRKYKGLDILIEAFGLIHKKHPDLKVLAAGEFYDPPQPYFDQIKKLGLEKKVKMINKFIPNEEVAKYFQVAEAVVMPYRSATQSGILNIAFGYGVPAVTTNVGGLGELVEDGKTGVLVDSPNAALVADGIERFLDLQGQVDFASNIKNKIGQNRFLKIADTFKEIMDDSVS